MARNRQRAKQRQAQRRAERLSERGRDGGDGRAPAPPPIDEAPPREEPPTEPETRAAGSAPELERPPEPPPGDDLLERADLATGAPPEDLGRSDAVLEPDPADEAELPDYDPEDEEQPLDAEAEAAAAPRRGEREPERRRGRVLEFLVNVWAELQRVQWPNRQQVITLTGVVLGFVLIAGGYLGALDAIFSRVIEAIL